MKSNELLEIIGEAQDEYVWDAKQPKKTKMPVWAKSAVSVAACLCLAAGILFGTGVLKFPGVQPNVEPDIEYYMPHDLLNREDFDRIIWGGGNEDDPTAENDPNQSGGGNTVVENGAWREWNGIKITEALYDTMTQRRADEVIAIGVKSLAEPEVKLSDYVFNGRTYAEILADCEEARQLRRDFLNLKDLSNIYGERGAELGDAFWEKTYELLEEEFVARYFADGEFDTTAISDDLNACETQLVLLENELDGCKREYNAKYNAVPALSRLMNKGYYVAGSNGVFAVMVPAGNMAAFAEDVLAMYDADLIKTVVFRLASRADLGIEDTHTNENDIVPGGVVEDLPVDDAQTE